MGGGAIITRCFSDRALLDLDESGRMDQVDFFSSSCPFSFDGMVDSCRQDLMYQTSNFYAFHLRDSCFNALMGE